MSTCIVTGAGSGIGRATAIEISNKKMFDNIVIIGRNEVTIQETKSLMEQSVNIKCILFNLSNLFQIEDLVQNIFHEYKSIDCLLNIAGYTDPQPLLTTDIKSVQKTYEINVFAPIELTKHVVKFMKKTKCGKILNVASTAGITPRPGWLSYASSKAALISISETLTHELAEYGIKVYCISPGRCATSLRRKLAPNEDPNTIMQPNEVAEIITRLISENENCLDGQNIIIRKQLGV